MRHLLVVLVFVLGCTSSSNKPTSVDAAAGGGGGDAPAQVKMDGGVKMDAPAGAKCTGQVYDACNPAASNCGGNTQCKTFNGSGFSVCTQACNAQNPCPMQNGQPVACNNMGICKPNAPNATCTAP